MPNGNPAANIIKCKKPPKHKMQKWDHNCKHYRMQETSWTVSGS